ncbi:hypothetical protein C7974DRAFT_310315 [Boeremia exigua]|uniref:uncharacterized protein n=1 Tax=Boeremia exigua TaxID=749465 RepID=UPI001E8D05EA|nr:uncharacterized protein C7974DRAFT_310315 [Boeremia exigua]KAH6633616.1 hypothetical protein C7974DRAFT_310315 [Boeremia exigua]
MTSPPKTQLIRTGPFALTAPPQTDLWRKPPATDVSTAPTHPATLPTYPLSSFRRARVTFSLPPAGELRQYDQAGLVLRFDRDGEGGEKGKWVKTGIEWYEGRPWVSTVACDAWADWSVVPLDTNTSTNTSSTADAETRPSATIEVERHADPLGSSLWVYRVLTTSTGETRVPLREINWVFAATEGWRVGVGGLVARPDPEGKGGELVGEFGGVEVEVDGE